MYTVTKSIHFCYGHRLLKHRGKCRHLHGHNARVEIELGSKKLNELGMVMDFYDIKTKIQAWIDGNLDHRLLLCAADPYLTFFRKTDEPVLVMRENPTAENIARLIFDAAKRMKLPVKKVTLWETDSAAASYSAD